MVPCTASLRFGGECKKSATHSHNLKFPSGNCHRHSAPRPFFALHIYSLASLSNRVLKKQKVFEFRRGTCELRMTQEDEKPPFSEREPLAMESSPSPRKRKSSRVDRRALPEPLQYSDSATGEIEYSSWESSPRPPIRSPKKVRFDVERHANSVSNFLLRALNVAYQFIQSLFIRPFVGILGWLTVYVMGFVLAGAVIWYSIYLLRVNLPSIPQLPFAMWRWLVTIPQLPASVVCITTGKMCPPDEHLLNITYAAKEEIRQASKVLNTLDRFEPSKSHLMTQSVFFSFIGN